MIVKVQLPLNHDEPQALIYNKDKSVFTQVLVGKEVVDAMDGKPKAFFHAHVKDKNIVLDKPAPWQSW